MTRIKIVGLGGSSAPQSTTLYALDAALAGARAAGAEVVLLDIHELALPMYEYGVSPPAVAGLIEHVRTAHGMIWCSPLYHGSVAGSFKNAIDWLELLHHDDPPYLTDMAVGLVATSGGEQALQAINVMEHIVRALRGFTVPLTAPVLHAYAAFDEAGQPRSRELAERLCLVGAEVVRAASKLASP